MKTSSKRLCIFILLLFVGISFQVGCTFLIRFFLVNNSSIAFMMIIPMFFYYIWVGREFVPSVLEDIHPSVKRGLLETCKGYERRVLREVQKKMYGEQF